MLPLQTPHRMTSPQDAAHSDTNSSNPTKRPALMTLLSDISPTDTTERNCIAPNSTQRNSSSTDITKNYSSLANDKCYPVSLVNQKQLREKQAIQTPLRMT